MAPAPDPTAPAAPAKAPITQITAKQWTVIETAWELGDVTYADLVSKYGRSVSTFERHFRTHKIIKGSKREEAKKRVEEAMVKNSINDATVIAARIKETKDQHYQMATAISRLTWSEILAAKNASKPYAVALPNLKALDSAMTILKKAREERYSVLGLDRPDTIDPDEVPDLVISELTAEQVKELRDRDHLDVDTSSVNQDVLDSSPMGDVEVEGEE